MGEESKKWVLAVTAQTPTNIAVIKYWGKRDEDLILPINDSISVTLDPEHLCTTTTVAVSPGFDQDRMWLNGKEFSLAGARYQRCLKEIRSRACDFEDEKKGIKITKKEWENLHVHIASFNNFPTAAGLASSAAGFACLVFALAKLMNVKDDNGQLSAIARQGSGSACRSLFGGFAKWIMGKNDNGSDSVAVQLADEKHWDELVIVIAVVSSRQKETSSTSGMRETVETSKLIEHRAKEVVPKRIVEMEEAIQNRDFPGKISAMGVKSVLSSLGRLISLEEAQRITAEIDKDGDGLVDLKDLAGLFRKRDIRIDVDGPSVFDPVPEPNALTDNYEKWMKRTEILLPITASGAHATACILSKATSAAGFIACVMVMLLRGTRWEAKAAARVLAKFAAAACMAAVLTSLANDLPRDYAWIVVVLAFVIPLGAVSFA